MNNPERTPRPPQPSAWEGISAMIKRDFPWVVVCLILLLCLFYVATLAADHENTCDARYRDFVIACYEATGAIPDGSAYNLSGFNLTLDQRTNGNYHLGVRS